MTNAFYFSSDPFGGQEGLARAASEIQTCLAQFIPLFHYLSVPTTRPTLIPSTPTGNSLTSNHSYSF